MEYLVSFSVIAALLAFVVYRARKAKADFAKRPTPPSNPREPGQNGDPRNPIP